MEIETNIETETPLPFFKKSETFPEGHTTSNMIKVSVPPTNNNSEFDNYHNIVQFDIPCTYNALDPKQLFFEGDILNPDKFAKEIDHSFHSLIKKMIIYNGVGEQIEIIEDYDWFMTLFFDMYLSKSERLKRRQNEGFGVNKYGTDTAILWPDIDLFESKTTYDILQSLNIKSDQSLHRQTEDNKDCILPGLENKRFDLFRIKDTLQPLNSWDKVENGQLLPYPSNFLNKKSNLLHFKIPLMSRVIGAWFDPENEDKEYRLIPLGIFKGGLKILIFLNQTAFSIMTNIKEFEALDLGKKIPFLENKNRFEEFLRQPTLENHQNPRRYILKNAFITMQQYKLEQSQLNQLELALENGLYTRSFRELEELNRLYLKPYPVLQYTKNLTRNNIHRILVAFTSDLYKKSAFARQHDRYNKGIESFTFKLNGEVYPRPSIKRFNSLNTEGEANCNFFYAELRKGLRKHLFEQEYFLTSTNFALNRILASDFAIIDCINKGIITTETNVESVKAISNPFNQRWRDYYKKEVINTLRFNEELSTDFLHFKQKEISKMNNYLDSVASKTIYALHLIDGESTKSEPGVDCELTCPFTIEMKRLENVEKEDPYSAYPQIIFFMHVFVEYWSAVQLNKNGQSLYA